MAESLKLTDLPVDILFLIFPQLDAKSFVALTRTCKAFYQPDIRYEHSYWSHATRSTFRVPNHPVIQADGRRWQALYKRLLTQSRVFTWGSNGHGCLGHSYDEDDVPPTPAHFRRRGSPLVQARARRRAMQGQMHNASMPTEVIDTRDKGIISDLQCGGWSTTILTAKGVLYTCGVFDGQTTFASNPHWTPLAFPAGFSKPERDSYDAFVATRQFSSGRSHVLGLTDSGTIWSWHDVHKPGVHVKFLHTDIIERTNAPDPSTRGCAARVVAGWDKSSAYISGTGILLWDVIRNPPQNVEVDTMLVADSVVVPQTSYLRPARNEREPNEELAELGESIGEVTSYIILEHFVVLVTDLHKVFASRIDWNQDNPTTSSLFEVPSLQQTSTDDQTPIATDVQGSFRSFAVFTSSGAVLTAKQDYLDAAYSLHLNPHSSSSTALTPTPSRIPCLQNAGVIQLAFGDYHFHALHASGAITSYGTEPQACGALGLGGEGDPEGRLRGIRYQGALREGVLLPHCYTRGRQVWFQREKRAWIRFLASGAADPGEAAERLRMIVREEDAQAEVSDWVEQEGRNWDKRKDVVREGDDGLGAHFALSVAAAGWHSGALVLVNEDLEERVKANCIIDDPDYVGKDEADEKNQDHDPGSDQSGGDSLLSGALTILSQLARSFVGLPLSSSSSATAAPQPPSAQQTNRPSPTPFTDPIEHGASPARGQRYVWAGDLFPRLRLRDGREMPGRGEFVEWR
ncbi:RCC1/BLIP-II, partial [Aulographum hederae CBS 113979]